MLQWAKDWPCAFMLGCGCGMKKAAQDLVTLIVLDVVTSWNTNHFIVSSTVLLKLQIYLYVLSEWLRTYLYFKLSNYNHWVLLCNHLGSNFLLYFYLTFYLLALWNRFPTVNPGMVPTDSWKCIWKNKSPNILGTHNLSYFKSSLS